MKLAVQAVDSAGAAPISIAITALSADLRGTMHDFLRLAQPGPVYRYLATIRTLL